MNIFEALDLKFRKFMRVLLVVTGLLFYSIVSQASYEYNKRCRDAYSHIVNLEFQKAQTLINKERTLNPSNHISIYLENNIDFVRLLVTNDEKLYDEIADDWENRIDHLVDLEDSSPFYRTCVAECKLQRAIVHINQREFFYGILELNRAYRLLVENEKLHPYFIPNKLYLGMLRTIFGAVPENYRWGIELLNFEGNIPKGIQQVEEVFEKSKTNPELSHLKQTSLLMLTFLKINYQSELLPDEQLTKVYRENLKDHPGPMTVYAFCRFMIAQGKNDEVLEFLKDYRQTTTPKVHAIDLMHGTALLRKLDPRAIQYFESFIQNHKGKNYKKQALRYIAWAHLMQGNVDGYKSSMKRCITSGNAFIDQDKVALREAQEGNVPNVHLLKARLLFDGGYYEQASVLLEEHSLDAFNEEDKLEYSYRLARIFNQVGDIEKAIRNYKLTIRNGKNSHRYYAANSALKLGAIYEKQNNYVEALKYYEMARNMNNEEYRSSINHKAKVGIKRIEAK